MKPKEYILAIDPGTTMSGLCLLTSEDYRPLWCGKVDNEKVFDDFLTFTYTIPIPPRAEDIQLVIERMQGNNMPVSSDVFLTCEWIGRFDVRFQTLLRGKTEYVFRREEYRALCGNLYSKNDVGIRSALVDRFAYGTSNHGKGSKKEPGWFYGFSADSWSAYAIGVTYLDKLRGGI